MGCTQSTPTLPPSIPPSHINRLLQVSQINHHLNVNKKYQHLQKISLDKRVGTGLKETFGYQCLTTKEELDSKRLQFWETRVNGSQEVWNVLKEIVGKTSNEEINSIICQHKLYPLNNSLQMVLDPSGNKYQLPIFTLHPPISFSSLNIASRNLLNQFTPQPIRLILRTTLFPNQDIVLQANTTSTIQRIKLWVGEKKGLGGKKMRLFYNGREMHQGKVLGNYGYVEGAVVQLMVKQ